MFLYYLVSKNMMILNILGLFFFFYESVIAAVKIISLV